MDLQTERLCIRDWDAEQDLEAAFEIYGDPEVMHWIRRPDADRTETQFRLRQRLAEQAIAADGLGIFAMVERGDAIKTPQTAQSPKDRPIGSILLERLPDAQDQPTAEVEIGWHLRRDRWGLGLATEAARAVMAYGFEQLHLPAIYAVILPGHQRSRRVAEKLDMEFLGLSDRYYGRELWLFRRDRPAPFPTLEDQPIH